MTGGRDLALLAAVAAVGCTGSDNDQPDGMVLLFDSEGLSAISVDSGRTTLPRLKPEPWGVAAYSRDGKRIAYEAENGSTSRTPTARTRSGYPGQPSVREFSNTNPSWSPCG